MPRPVSNNLFLNHDEYTWLIKFAARKAQMADKLETKTTKDERARLAVIDLKARLEPLPVYDHNQEQFVVTLRRIDLRIIQKWARAELDALTMAVVPGYQDRINQCQVPEERERLKEYLDKSVERAKLMEGVLNKISKRLR